MEINIEQIFRLLSLPPNRHLVRRELNKLVNIPSYKGFVFTEKSTIDADSFLDIQNSEIFRCKVEGEISLYDETGKHFDKTINLIILDIFITFEKYEWNRKQFYHEPLILGMDELIFYLNNIRNNEVKKSLNIVKLEFANSSINTEDFISKGRLIRNQYFSSYNGGVFDMYFEVELNELFAIITSSLAFLLRNKDRVFEELELITDNRNRLELFIFPRFNNTISELAGGIYNFWERISFILNEFYPINKKMPPSFNKYFSEQKKNIIRFPILNNCFYQELSKRASNEHLKLSELRHSLIHYNSTRIPSGTRSANHIKRSFESNFNIENIKSEWEQELIFLTSEVNALTRGLECTLYLIEEWSKTISTDNSIKLTRYK